MKVTKMIFLGATAIAAVALASCAHDKQPTPTYNAPAYTAPMK